jgi:hypothetical protein
MGWLRDPHQLAWWVNELIGQQQTLRSPLSPALAASRREPGKRGGGAVGWLLS